MKKRIALVLCLVLVLSAVLCGCGSEQDKLVGTWKTTVNMAESYNQELASDPEMAEYLSVETLEIGFTLTFNEDGTYALTVDPASMDAAAEVLAQSMTDGLKNYFTDILAAQGVEMDVEEALAAMGMDLDTLVEELKNEAFSEEAYTEMNVEGRYKVEDGKLYLTEDVNAEPAGGEYNTYTLEGATLTLEAGSEADSDMAFMFPMVLERAE